VRDTYLAMEELRRAAEVRLAGGRRQVALSQLVVRTEPLGHDRYGRRHWALAPLDDCLDQIHLWAEPRTSEVQGGTKKAPRVVTQVRI